MDRETARILLSSFLDRVEADHETGGRKLEGRISELEWQALNCAMDLLGGVVEHADQRDEGQPGSSTIEALVSPEAQCREEAAQVRRNILERSRALQLTEPTNPEVLLCLDFGTAKSKAFAVRKLDDHSLELLELGLGRQAGEAGAYSVTSSLWISDDGVMYFGEAAVRRSLGHGDEGRERLDSLKQQLSQGFSEQLGETLLDAKVNPTGIPLNFGEAITAYLGYLTHLAARD